MSDEIFVPEADTLDDKMKFQKVLASWTPAVLLRNLFRAFTAAGNNLCSFSNESMELMAKKFDPEHVAAALAKCPCDSCKLKVDYVAEVGPVLLEVAQKLADLHRKFAPRARAISEKADRRRESKKKLERELGELENAGKLGKS